MMFFANLLIIKAQMRLVINLKQYLLLTFYNPNFFLITFGIASL